MPADERLEDSADRRTALASEAQLGGVGERHRCQEAARRPRTGVMIVGVGTLLVVFSAFLLWPRSVAPDQSACAAAAT
jgi:hypothetical protein